MIDLLISSYECKELFFFLQKEKIGLCLYNYDTKQSFIPMTEAEALKKNFKNDSNVNLPEGDNISNVTEKFQFYDEKENKYFNCERTYNINSSGQVVEFLGEKLTPIDQVLHGLYGGILGEEFFKNN